MSSILPASRANLPWIIFRLEFSFFAISSDYVKAMIALTNVRSFLGNSSDIHGITVYDGQPTYLIDMRSRLGLKTFNAEIEDFCGLMDAREKDHINWLETLEKCVLERKEFTLAIDPTKCKFGRWYYDILPKIKNKNLLIHLEQFDEPHKKIHAIAEKAFLLIRVGKNDEAIELIGNTRDNQLSKMINLFAKIKQTYRTNQKQIAIIIDQKYTKNPQALVVDEVVMVGNLSQKKPIGAGVYDDSKLTSFVTGFGEFEGMDSLVMILDMSDLVYS